MSELMLWGISIMVAIFAPIILAITILGLLYTIDAYKKYLFVRVYLLAIIFITIFVYFLLKYLMPF